jgi:hypothetical protein
MAQGNAASNVGSVLGGLAGTAIGGPVGGMAGQALGSVAGGLLSVLPSLIKTDEERLNAERLKNLKRRQDLNTLGFTEDERQQLYMEQDSAAQKAQQDVKDLQSGVASSLATGAGAASRNFVAEQENLIRARAAAEREVQKANLLEKKAQTEELEKRTMLGDQYKGQKQAAIAGVAMTGIGALDESIAKMQAVRGAKPTPEQIKQFMTYTGLDEKQTAEIIGRIARDPSAAGIYGGIVGSVGGKK